MHAGFAQVSGVEHVVLIGVDGMSPDGIRMAETPVQDELMNEGAFSMHTRVVRPTQIKIAISIPRTNPREG